MKKTDDMVFNPRVKMGFDGIKLTLRDKKSAAVAAGEKSSDK